MKWSQPLKPIGKADASRRTCEIWLGHKGKGSEDCYDCGLPNVDWCYNCERTICASCSDMFTFLLSPPYCLRVCKECEADNTMGSN